MSLEEKSFIETDSKFKSGICLNKYNNEISICSAHRDEDKVYLDWVYPQTKQRIPSTKTLPWKIGLGTHKAAQERLQQLCNILKGPGKAGKTETSTTEEKNDVPF